MRCAVNDGFARTRTHLPSKWKIAFEPCCIRCSCKEAQVERQQIERATALSYSASFSVASQVP